MLPVAEIQFADFIHPAFDQLVSEAARIRYRSNGDWNVPLVVRTPYGGGVHGALYHSQSIEAFYGHVPGPEGGGPRDAATTSKGMLRAAIRDPDPVLFLEHKKTYRLIKGDVPDEPYEVADRHRRREARGRPAQRDRVRADAALLPGGRRASCSRRRASRPRSSTCGRSPRSTGRRSSTRCARPARRWCVYEDNRTYGAGAEISATIAEELLFDLDGPLVRMGGPDIPAMPFASHARARLHARSSAHLRADEGAREVLAEGEAPEPLAGRSGRPP